MTNKTMLLELYDKLADLLDRQGTAAPGSVSYDALTYTIHNVVEEIESLEQELETHGVV